MTIARGSRLGHYEIVAPLGAGGMGAVYRARDTRVGREVAVKILPRDFATDPARRRRFEREARLAASLNHPNIVGLFDVGIAHDPPYIVSELVSGVSLRAVMSRGAIPLRKVLDLGAQMAEGIAAAHGAGVVHRDLKPENVMVTPESRVKILDFGLARVDEGREAGASGAGTQVATVGLETPQVTTPGTVVGTVSYMSPEQALGHTVDYRSDQFSFGLVLYEMLGRRRAFDRASTAQTMAAIIEDESAPLPPTIPTQVRWLVDRCLAKDPSHRYASTLDLARELRDLWEHVGELTSASGESAVAVSGRRRRGAWNAGILAAGLAALALLGLSWKALYVEEPLLDLNAYRKTPFVTVLKACEWASWSPDGKSIAFQGWVEEEAGNQLWIQGLDAPAPVQLTHAPFAPLSSPFWSPDSRMIYCPGFAGVTTGIFRISAGGGDPVLVQPEAEAGSLSPDGQTLVMYAREGRDKPYRVWYASPPDGPRQLYAPAPFENNSEVTYPLIAFAPDGRKVLVSVPGAGAWLLPWPPGQGRRIQISGAGQGISWMPDSRHVVSGSGVLAMSNVRTGRRWPFFWGGTNASVSPDGQRIAYVAQESQWDVIEMPLGGGPPRTLVGTRAYESMPALSADGKELVYCRGSEVWSISLGDGSMRRLVGPGDVPADSGFGAGGLCNPNLSRDGRRVAFEVMGGKHLKRPIGWSIYVAFAAGGAPVRAVEADSSMQEVSPAWSPEGDRLAYLSKGDTDYLQVVRPGGMDRPVSLWGGESWFGPEWSPDGKWIAVADTSHVILVSSDGRAKRDLRTRSGPMAWAPDGGTLFVVHFNDRGATVDAIDIRTGAEREVRDLGDQYPSSFHAPGLRICVTPNGKSLVYSVRRWSSDIWLLEGAKIPKAWYARLWPW